jgi:hypothetical protein
LPASTSAAARPMPVETPVMTTDRPPMTALPAC